MTMPKLTGIELAQQLQKTGSPPPIIICTGHNEGMSKDDFFQHGVQELLLKPVTANKLAQVVRELLDTQNHD
jgi:CheY-like chemotaxis protein